ncbi:PREDICTED: uncharacterized protein LOC105970697 [Erythranthe guttata]|uniref:uncharacterized protein LOC105970697 n=1 Tax=Erythranthe guttata TaxID=4155 RepID=UPI00064DEF6E|nr:PREDICTED: uncharacterized protein LOC105970697 [Erythranthe guttata]|eukprot:XP_012850984.1 PREDICTED: uncharacterized protein LOC105970697 [Erythranthe guttata]
MSNNRLASILDSKLNGNKYIDWLCNLRIVLTLEGRTYLLDDIPPNERFDDSTEEEVATYEKWKQDDLTARCYMIAAMSPELVRKYETFATGRGGINVHLDTTYGKNVREVRFLATKELMSLNMREGTSVQEHALKMISLIEKLANIDVVLPIELTAEILLLSLPSSYESFIVNFNMNKLGRDG